MVNFSKKCANKMILLLLLVLVGASCKNRVDSSIAAPVVELSSECLLKNIDIFMKYPYKIKVVDSLMCVWDLHGGDRYFHVFSYPALKFIISFGESGRGDKEFVNTGGFVMDRSYIYIFDSYRSRLNIFSVDSLVCQRINPVKIVNYPETCIPVLSFTKMENGYALLNYNGKERITFVDTLGQVISKKYEYPIVDTVEFKKYRAFAASLWDSFIDYNPQNKILGVVTKLGDVLEIYDLANDSSKVIIGPGGTPGMLKRGNSVSVGKIDGFSDIQVKTESIYALYSGLNQEEIHNQMKRGIRTPNGGNMIYKYDLQGKLKKIYKLDRYIDGFDLHEDEGMFFTVSSDDEHSINRYKIPDIS